MGGATSGSVAFHSTPVDFNPRSPWGERPCSPREQQFFFLISIHAPRGGSDQMVAIVFLSLVISIHAPRGGSDKSTTSDVNHDFVFQSTLPVGGATSGNQGIFDKGQISIHAPRGGSDTFFVWLAMVHLYFNPRSPWGERLLLLPMTACRRYFNPRSPWGERLAPHRP